MDDNNELIVLRRIEDSFNRLNDKIINIWRLVGLLMIAAGILLGALFCQNVAQAFLVFLGVLILCGLWYIFFIKNTWKLQSDFNIIRVIGSFDYFKIILRDMALVEIFKARLESSEFRDKLQELEIIFNKIETIEYKILLSEIMKERGIFFENRDKQEKALWNEFFEIK